MTLSVARKFADAPFGAMMAASDKIVAAIAVLAAKGTGPDDATRAAKLTATLANRPT